MSATEEIRDPSILGFCKRHGISRASFYNLKAAGKAPRLYYVGAQQPRISPDAEADWVRAREAEQVAAEAAPVRDTVAA
jgi:hypothetical protein